MDLREDMERATSPSARDHRHSVVEAGGKRGGHDGLIGYDVGKR